MGKRKSKALKDAMKAFNDLMESKKNKEKMGKKISALNHKKVTVKKEIKKKSGELKTKVVTELVDGDDRIVECFVCGNTMSVTSMRCVRLCGNNVGYIGIGKHRKKVEGSIYRCSTCNTGSVSWMKHMKGRSDYYQYYENKNGRKPDDE